MKRFLSITLLALLAPFLVLAAPKVPTLTDEQKKQAEDTVDSKVEGNAKLEASYEVRKQAILKGVTAALQIVDDVEQSINANANFSTEQKSELKKITANVEELLTNYQKEVSAAEDSDDLYAAAKNVLKNVSASREQIRSSIATVVMIGIEQTLKLAQDFFKAAETISQAIKICGADTTQVDVMIADGKKDLAELNTAYQALAADDKITEDEKADLKSAAKLATELTVTMGKITVLLEQLSVACGG